MVSGGFVPYCMGMTTEHGGIDVFIARPALAYIKRFPVIFGHLRFMAVPDSNEDEDSYGSINSFEVVNVLIDNLLTGVQVHP